MSRHTSCGFADCSSRVVCNHSFLLNSHHSFALAALHFSECIFPNCSLADLLIACALELFILPAFSFGFFVFFLTLLKLLKNKHLGFLETSLCVLALGKQKPRLVQKENKQVQSSHTQIISTKVQLHFTVQNNCTAICYSQYILLLLQRFLSLRFHVKIDNIPV